MPRAALREESIPRLAPASPEVRETTGKTSVTSEAITAAGRSCIGLGKAIAELARNGFTNEARELSEQLKLTSKSLRWLIREEREVTPQSKVNAESRVCLWMTTFLAGPKPHSATEIIEAAEKEGFSKSEIFQARSLLRLDIERKYGKQLWSLPSDS